MDLGKLYEQPFTFINPAGIDGVFSEADADNIIQLISEVNNNAKIYNLCLEQDRIYDKKIYNMLVT